MCPTRLAKHPSTHPQGQEGKTVRTEVSTAGTQMFGFTHPTVIAADRNTASARGFGGALGNDAVVYRDHVHQTQLMTTKKKRTGYKLEPILGIPSFVLG